MNFKYAIIYFPFSSFRVASFICHISGMCLLFLPGICLHNSFYGYVVEVWYVHYHDVSPIFWAQYPFSFSIPFLPLHRVFCLLSSLRVLIVNIKLYTYFSSFVMEIHEFNNFIWFNSPETEDVCSRGAVCWSIKNKKSSMYMSNLIILTIYLKKSIAFL